MSIKKTNRMVRLALLTVATLAFLANPIDGREIKIVAPSPWANVEAPSGALHDFDADGNVDGDDFLIWQAGFGIQSGATHYDGDADLDGDVDGDDFLLWQANFDPSFAGGEASASPTVRRISTQRGLSRRRPSPPKSASVRKQNLLRAPHPPYCGALAFHARFCASTRPSIATSTVDTTCTRHSPR